MEPHHIIYNSYTVISYNKHRSLKYRTKVTQSTSMGPTLLSTPSYSKGRAAHQALHCSFSSGLSEQDNKAGISSCQYWGASILTCLTPFTDHGMNQSHLVYSLGTRTKKRSTT